MASLTAYIWGVLKHFSDAGQQCSNQVHMHMQSSKLIISKRGSVYFNCNAKIGHPSEPVKIHPKQFEELLTKCREEMNATRIARSAATGIGKFLIIPMVYNILCYQVQVLRRRRRQGVNVGDFICSNCIWPALEVDWGEDKIWNFAHICNSG